MSEENNGWHYIHLNEAGRKECFSGVFETEDKAIEWFKEWGAYWSAKGVNLVKHTYKYGLTSNGYYFG